MSVEPIRVRDPEGTKRAVLDAAERLFAATGFAGTSMRDIALESGVSHPLIQHHFGTKEGLYSAVLRQCGEDYSARFPDLVGVTDRPVDLPTEMTRLFGFLREKRPLLRMIGWARLEGRLELLSCGEPLKRAMIRRIEVAQQRGLVRDDIPAATLGVMMEGLLLFWVEHRAMIERRSEAMPDDEVYLAQAIALLQRGFSPASDTEPRGAASSRTGRNEELR